MDSLSDEALQIYIRNLINMINLKECELDFYNQELEKARYQLEELK